MVTAAQKAAASKPAKKAATAPVAESAKVNLRLVANNAATARLKDAHRDQFEGFLAEECGKRGVPYSRALTEAEKAAKQIAEYVRKFGHLILPDDEEVNRILHADDPVPVPFDDDPIALPAEPVTDEVEDEHDVATDDPEAVEADLDDEAEARAAERQAALAASDID
jgi:hypothetical protein